jgi:uncharacterized protein
MAETHQDIGTVGSLWRYPVKSMAGERLESVTVTAKGLRGDRAYALVDREDGRVATAKNPRKWPRLFEFSARLPEEAAAVQDLPPVLITLPDGSEVSSAEPAVERVLSGALGRDIGVQQVATGNVAVVQSASANPWTARSEEYWPDLEGLDFRDTVTDFELPEGTFFDCAFVHVLTTSSLSRLHELYPEGDMATRRFRPNVVVDSGDAAGFVENDWVGRTLRLGEEVRLAVTGPCPRCVMVTLPQGDLPKDTGILRTVARHNDTHVGVYAAVLQGGRVRRSDLVSLG